ncbi:MAG: carbohydrate binding domain-containing protein, partial [Draconibacterium sp.]|nr:carbohydrate binding domain-containing protein [Draconibacterium sp.]
TPVYPFESDKNLVITQARELRKMGVNMVRFHLMDSRVWSASDIFGVNEGTRTFDPVQIDRMDFMISELKKQGIYVYIDLLCDRHYTASDGVQYPDSVYRAAKEVNFFDPYLIELQKEYASQLLTHVNPYTGLALKDDPVMAIMEIVNEGWFLHSVRCDMIKPASEGGVLSHYHYNMLTGLWNDFLIEKYSIDQNLKTAWGYSSLQQKTLDNPGFENDFTNWTKGFWGQVQATQDISTTEFHSGGKSFHINVTTPSVWEHECYLQHSNLPFEKDKSYTLTFWAKSEDTDTIVINIAQTEEPWTSVARRMIIISGDWKEYKCTFGVDQVWANDPHMMFYLGKVRGNLWIDDVELYEGIDEISDGGSLSERNIKLLNIGQNYTEPNRQRQMDQSEFYMELQIDYFAEMKSYLKQDIGVQIPIAGSNFLVGIPDSYVQSTTDFIDQHGYWGLGPDPKVSMLDHTNFNNAILNLFAGVGVKNKPLTASEYNYEMPNEYANEALFFLTAYSSFQNADMAMIHIANYQPLHFGGMMLSSLDNYNRIFDRAMFPGFAYAYRNRLISSAQQTININFTDEDIKNLVFHSGELWETNAFPNDYPFELMYQHGLRTEFGGNSAYNVNNYPTRPTNPYKSDTDEIEWDENGLFSINAPQFLGLVGKIHEYGGKTIGPVQLISGDKSSGLTLLSLDNKNISESEKMLMTFTTQQKHDGEEVENGIIVEQGQAPRLLESAEIQFKLN